jgi:O-antigen/teichoic acid export membrane protein
MKKLRELRRRPYGLLASNVAARVAAMGALALGTLIVGRAGGPAAVGIFTLLRVIPSLLGVMVSCGLPGATTYFLAGPDREDRRLPLTIVAMALAGGVVSALLWMAAAPIAGHLLLPGLSLSLLLVAGATVFTQLFVATVKSCSQGSDDLPGSNLVIFNEEFMFLPPYGLMLLLGAHGYAPVVIGLLLADLLTCAWAWTRLARRGLFKAAQRPSLALARRIASYGWRQQVGGVMTLLNLRLDFIILNVMAGPAVLGVYAIASKFAELLKVPGMALTYVLYPLFARQGPEKAAATARRMILRGGGGIALAVVPLVFLAGPIIPAAYGASFKGAVTPTQIIAAGLALEGVAGIISGFLYGTGRPGLNSWAMGAGLVLTVILDLLLIPRAGAIGAAVASAVAYMATSIALIYFFSSVTRAGRPVLETVKLTEVDAG